MEPHGLSDLGQWMTWARIPGEADALLQDFYMKTRDKGALKLGRLLFPLYDFSLSSFRKEGRRPPRA